MVVATYSYYHSTSEAEAGRVQSQPWLYSEFRVNLNYVARPTLEETKWMRVENVTLGKYFLIANPQTISSKSGYTYR